MNQRWRAKLAPIMRDPAEAIVAFALVDVVAQRSDDPAVVRVHPEVPERLARLRERGFRLVCITDRRALDAREILEDRDVTIYGLCGAQLLEAGCDDVVDLYDLDPVMVPAFLRSRLGRIGIAGLRVEPRGAVCALDRRRATHPFDAEGEMRRIAIEAARFNITPVPGNQCLELRPPNAPHKGDALRAAVGDRRDTAVLWIGVDKSDDFAQRTLRELEAEGAVRAGICVAVLSDAEDQRGLRRGAALVIDGTDDTVELLRFLDEALIGSNVPPRWPRRT